MGPGTAMNLKKFSRQIILSEIGAEGQKRLTDARVLCIGAGGLGSPVALYLAAAGVGTLGLIDDDRVDLTNLQRQILFAAADEGRMKTDAAQGRLQALNPDTQIVTHTERFNVMNAESLLNRYDLVIDGSDNFATKFLVNDAAYRAGIPLVYGAVNRFEGQVALFQSRMSSCYRCLYRKPPATRVQNCAEAGVLGSVVGTIGTLQATLALQFLISKGDPSHPLCPETGMLTLFDFGGAWSVRSVKIERDACCPTCSVDPAEVTLTSEPESCALSIDVIDAETLVKALKDPTQNLLLVDVRESDEWAQGHLPGAIHWPLSRIERGEYPKRATQQTVVAYCAAGARSNQAARLLLAAGFDRVKNLSGGTLAWPGPWA